MCCHVCDILLHLFTAAFPSELGYKKKNQSWKNQGNMNTKKGCDASAPGSSNDSELIIRDMPKWS